MDYSEIQLRQTGIRKELAEALERKQWVWALDLAQRDHAAARALVVWIEARITPLGHEEDHGD